MGNCLGDKDYLKCINRAPKPVSIAIVQIICMSKLSFLKENSTNLFWELTSFAKGTYYITFVCKGGRALSPFFGPPRKPKIKSYHTKFSLECLIR